MSAEEIAKLQKEKADWEVERVSLQQKLEDEKVMRETTQRLLENQDLVRKRQDETTRIKEVQTQTTRQGEEKLSAAVDAALARYTQEDFENPAKLREIMKELGMQVTRLAFEEATGRVLRVVSDTVKSTADVQNIASKWRKDNPDLVEHEDMMEFYYERKTDSNASIDARIEDATKQLRDKLGIEKTKGKNEARSESANVRRQRVMTPERGNSNATTAITEETTPTLSEDEQRKDLGNFLNTRRKLQVDRSKARY
jgi:hypothetical protein